MIALRRWIKPTTALLLSLSVLAIPARAQGRGPTPVAAATAVEREIPASLRLVGSIQADRQAVVACEVAGLVTDFAAEQGQFLHRGDEILRLDRTVQELNLAEAEARLAGLQSALAELEQGDRAEVRRRLKEAVGEASAWVEKWRFEVERLRNLLSANQTSQKELHDAEMELAVAEARLSQARAANEMSENGSRPEEVARARYAAAAQAAVVARQKRDLEKTSLRAPFDGFLVAKRTEIGEWVSAGGPVCDMVAIEKVRVRTDAPESAIPFATVGQPASVEVEALGVLIGATITRVVPLAAPNARTFPIEIDLPNEDHRLLPGMFVWAHVPAAASGKRLMVPKDAVVARGTEKMIFIVRDAPAAPNGGPPAAGGSPPAKPPTGESKGNEPGRNGQGSPAGGDSTAHGEAGPAPKMAFPTPVTTGLEVEGLIEVHAPGLQPGELVVVRANERLNPLLPSPVIPMPPATSQVAAQE